MTALSMPIQVSARTKWIQMVLGLICMASISSPQYVWTLMTKPFTEKIGVSLPELQVTFSLLIILQTFFSPFQGKLIDRFGPRLLISLGTVLSGLSWVLSAQVQNLAMLYLVYGCLGGLGTGIVYVGVVGLMVRWFPRHRGFAAGMVAAGYGMGAILTTFPISISLGQQGLEWTLLVFGSVFALVGLLASQGLRVPVDEDTAAQPPSKLEQSQRQFASREMLRQPLFWLMFLMMAMMSTSGLMVTSQMAIFAHDFGITSAVVFGMAALPLALTIDRFTNGLTRPLFGFISDRFGRENTMFIAFTLEGCAMTLWLMSRDNALLFVLLSGVVFFGWGEIFSLFPSTLTDTFGTQNATANYGWLYMSQGVGSILGGPLAALLYQYTQGWHVVFGTAITLDFVTAALALWVLKPWRSRFIRSHS
ncbi:oxalate/formate MFS antiporter [Lonsdalea populi]|uniref:oxalate/formate MFS antiporter n=1 Tax=Lonsdalea populi TaxID=1172565 RepID=UPI000A226553|nr:oxalate/formate MFS antiporter [Lonsdalea populi]OSM99630.1 oxalate/formate MFS antiporter [Lonsdalea populi]RAT68239.1 oxalate/formate MFS antiporter [Lonsdalea populi]RAT72190.1 oxalate/formate MFS antiporter [Lonsdalea populi]RAT76156.1 oxalate/formate MFS antiporter [Lonsdalea populi]RAT79062.1 oxalate/formate MFS antiporter [Lonsdalea populi]